MVKFIDYLNKCLQNDEFKKYWEAENLTVDVTDEDYFNDLVNDLNIQMQNNSNFDMVFYNMDLEDYNCEVLDDYFEEEIDIK